MKKLLFFCVLTFTFLPLHLCGQYQHLGSGLNPTPGLTVWGLESISPDTIWAMPYVLEFFSGNTRSISRTTDGGNTWTSSTIPAGASYTNYTFFALNADTAWAGLSIPPQFFNSKLFRTNDGGNSWTEQTGPFNNAAHQIAAIHFFDKDEGIAFGGKGRGPVILMSDTLRIYTTSDGGNSWARIHPSELPQPISVGFGPNETHRPTSGSNAYDAKGDTLWFGSTLGRVWRSTDRGQNWAAYATGGTGNLGVHFKDALNGLAVDESTTQGYRTTDGGTSWTAFTTPSRFRFLTYVPGTANSYVAGNVFAYAVGLSFYNTYLAVTTDAGLTWDSLHFSYPVFITELDLFSAQSGIAGGAIVTPDSGGVIRWIGDLSMPNPDCKSCVQSLQVLSDQEDFEGNGGTWCQEGGDDIDWELNAGPTQSAGTGPPAAYEGNFYIFTEASGQLNPTFLEAILVSPCYELNPAFGPSASFSFAYHMEGTDIGTLEVAVSLDSGQSWSTPVWSVSGSQGAAWQTDTVELTSYMGNTIRLRIRGETGNGFASDIAIDKLHFSYSNALGLSAVVTDNICHGDSAGQIVANAGGGIPPLTYLWSNGATTPTISMLASGTYSLTVSDSNAITISGSYVVQEPPALNLAINSLSPTCFGLTNGSASVLGSGGTGAISYLWSTGDTTTSISNLGNGVYTVTITDANNCMFSEVLDIIEPDSLQANLLISNVSCPGDTDGSVVALTTGGTAPYFYNWSTGSTDSFLVSLTPSFYNLSLSDANNCLSFQAFQIGSPSAVSSQLTTMDATCYGITDGSIQATASGGNGGFAYFWSTGDSTDLITGLGPGTYMVSVSDSLGCSGSDSATISQPDSLFWGLTGTDETGPGANDGSISLTVIGGTSPYTYAWSNGATSEDLTGISGGTYTVVITDANGCTEADSLTIMTGGVGVSPDQILSGFLLYPNPAGEVLNVHFTESISGSMHFSIYDLRGRQLMHKSYEALSVEDRVLIDIAHLSPGTYLLRIDCAKGSATVKWIRD